MIIVPALPQPAAASTIQVTKPDSSAWTDEEIASLNIYADGTLLTASQGSSYAWLKGSYTVVTISRDEVGKTTIALQLSEARDVEEVTAIELG